MYHQLSTVFMTSALKILPSLLLQSKISFNFSSSAHCTLPPGFPFSSPIPPLPSSSILLDTLPSSSLCNRPGIVMRACLLLDARNHFLSDFFPNFLVLVFLYLLLSCFFLATFLHCNEAAPSATSAHSVPVSPCLSGPQRTLLCAVSTQSLPQPSFVNFSLRGCHTQ